MTLDSKIILPLIVATIVVTVIATLLARRLIDGPADELQPARRGTGQRPVYRPDYVAQTLVSSVEHEPALVVRESERAGDVIDLLHESEAIAVPVVGADGELRGMVTAADLAWHATHDPRAEIGSFLRPVRATLTSGETLERAAALLTDPTIALLPIVDANTGRLTAVVTQRDLLAAYRSLAKK